MNEWDKGEMIISDVCVAPDKVTKANELSLNRTNLNKIRVTLGDKIDIIILNLISVIYSDKKPGSPNTNDINPFQTNGSFHKV